VALTRFIVGMNFKVTNKSNDNTQHNGQLVEIISSGLREKVPLEE